MLKIMRIHCHKDILGIRGLLGWFIAGVLSLAITSVFVMLYNYSGTHIVNPSGATDYKWPARQYKANLTEGINLMHMDANGFNNLSADTEDIDILLMGSSHMEAIQFPTEYNTGSLLNNMLSDMKTYNIGMSGHQLDNCLDNLEAAVDEYGPSKYLVLQSGNLSMSKETMKLLLDGSLADIPSYDSGIVYYMQKIPIIKVIYKQLNDKISIDTAREREIKTLFGGETVDDLGDSEEDELMLKDILEEKNEYCKSHGVKLVIAYTPPITISAGGAMKRGDEDDLVEMFNNVCKSLDIEFIDCFDAFEENYENTYNVPYGFNNTAVGTGHLNRAGHKILAQEIARAVGGNK